MARIIYCHPSRSKYEYHIYTDLDFWDARKVIRDLASVKRNFGNQPSGDDFPTQIVGSELSKEMIREIEGRIKKAIASPARHVIVREMIFQGRFEFDPLEFYPSRWSRSRMLHFTYRRLPMEQAVVSNAYQTVKLLWKDDNRIAIERVQRSERYDPVIRTEEEARQWIMVPSCF